MSRHLPINDVARYVLGCHPSWLRAEIRKHPEAWKPLLKPGPDGVALMDAVAVADAAADVPDALTFPATRPDWNRRGGRRHR